MTDLSSAITFVIAGPPRTKKTSNRIVRCGRFSKILPSLAFLEWQNAAAAALQGVKKYGGFPITHAVNCRALFFRERLVGDACGFYQGLADLLQHHGIVKNDSQIRTWDGSRLLKDPVNPRVIVTLEATEA
ncbi:MAG: hypothetical protein M3O20_01970 [Acidobacteriota bacterium]|nr:hypothetical protein [Acidobacteriota bacterium]